MSVVTVIVSTICIQVHLVYCLASEHTCVSEAYLVFETKKCIFLNPTVASFGYINPQLTQKMDPQYSSRAAAHMVHNDGFSCP